MGGRDLRVSAVSTDGGEKEQVMAAETKLGRREFLAAAGTAAFGLSFAGLAGCGSDDAPAGGGASGGGGSKAGAVGIAAAGSALGSAGVMRQALGIAAKDDPEMKVAIQDMAQGTALLSLKKGSVQTAMMSWVNLATFAKEGSNAVGIAPAWASHASVLVKADAPYKSVEEIKGLRVVTPERVTGVYTETRLALKKFFGLDFEKEAKVTPMGESAVAIALFKKGQFDVYIDSEPAISLLLADGTAKELFQVGSYEAQQRGGAYVPVNSWGVRRDWLEKHDPERMAQLFRKASEIAKTSPEPYAAAAKAGGLDAKAQQMFMERFQKLIVTDFSVDALKSAQEDMADAKRFGIIDFDVDPTKLAWTA
jgi:ABC-type nitrate/sulfonate/bicarbonate transport system substrate-binding protein